MRARASGLMVRFFTVAWGANDAVLVAGDPPFLVAAQRWRCASAMRARASGLMVRFFAVAWGADLVVEVPDFLVAAQRWRCASAMRALASGLSVRLPVPFFLAGAAGAVLEGEGAGEDACFEAPVCPKRPRISAIALSISFLRCSSPSNAYCRKSCSE
jgi:hypothetical protein